MNKHSKYSIFIMIMNTAATTKATANNNNMQSMLIIFEKTKKIYKNNNKYTMKKKKIIIQLQKQINTQSKRKVKKYVKMNKLQKSFWSEQKENKIKCEIKKIYLKTVLLGGFSAYFLSQIIWHCSGKFGVN